MKDGDLPLKIEWLLNGKELNDFSDITISSAGRRGSILTIESTQYEHAGNFTCNAENEAGKVDYTAGLQVNGYYFFFFYLCSIITWKSLTLLSFSRKFPDIISCSCLLLYRSQQL